MVKESRRQMAAIMTVKRRIYTTILDGDTAAKRFAIFLGFVPADDEMQAPASSHFGRIELSRRFDVNEEARIPIGNGYSIAMCYRQQEAA
jgi:SRSO17 transposase